MPNTQRINRRELLKSSGAATFATVGAPLFARNLFAGDSPNDKINVASIGVGGRGTGIGLQAAKLGSTLACCDVSYKNAERFQKQVKAAGGGECRMYSDYRELLAKEVPYAIAVTVESYREPTEDGKPVYVEAVIHVERPSQKGILIGASGAVSRQIGSNSRRKIEDLLGQRVYLDLHVKGLRNWRKREGSLKLLGFQRPH